VKVLGAERRRRWNYDEKVRLVEESLQAGETVCGAAAWNGSDPQAWLADPAHRLDQLLPWNWTPPTSRSNRLI